MKGKARGNLAAMKAFFHHNQATGNINHFPDVCTFIFLHIFLNLKK